MSDDIAINDATSDGDLIRLLKAVMVDLGDGRRGVADPLVYEALFQLRLRQLVKTGAPVADAEGAAREATLRDIERLAAQQVEAVIRERRPGGPTPLPADVEGEDEASPAELMQLLSDWEAGKADPEQVRRALVLTRDYLAAGTPFTWALGEFIGHALNAYLDSDCSTLDRSFGLTRRKGRPPADEDMAIGMAESVFRLRLAGETHQVALEMTSESFGFVESVVGDAWGKYKGDARNTLVTERELAGPLDASGNLFSPEESERIWRMMK